eukprot:TRINITY_DN8626_c0_g1_i4.p1 TRINITY_DN8626_c0_g1~~TRINITY_DN8626_c0_g1_i4.p1  ORF type:complete len:198 (-),score=-22.36 TRINITY_DN8626_c0_g1_i4:333-926(-)
MYIQRYLLMVLLLCIRNIFEYHYYYIQYMGTFVVGISIITCYVICLNLNIMEQLLFCQIIPNYLFQQDLIGNRFTYNIKLNYQYYIILILLDGNLTRNWGQFFMGVNFLWYYKNSYQIALQLQYIQKQYVNFGGTRGLEIYFFNIYSLFQYNSNQDFTQFESFCQQLEIAIYRLGQQQEVFSAIIIVIFIIVTQCII